MEEHEGVAVFAGRRAGRIDHAVRRRTKHAVGPTRDQITSVDDGRARNCRCGDPAVVRRLNFQSSFIVLKQQIHAAKIGVRARTQLTGSRRAAQRLDSAASARSNRCGRDRARSNFPATQATRRWRASIDRSSLLAASRNASRVWRNSGRSSGHAFGRVRAGSGPHWKISFRSPGRPASSACTPTPS